MIILQPNQTKILRPVPVNEWRQSSQRSGLYTVENSTQFCVKAIDPFGRVIWKSWFEDRYDFDAFLYALYSDTLKYQPALWGSWDPDISYPGVTYEFKTWILITNTATTSWTKVSDWMNNPDNEIGAIGGGGGANGGGLGGNGGGAGAFGGKTGLTLTLATYTIQIGTGGGGVNGVLGGSGTASWFNGANLAASEVGGDFGVGGNGGGAGSTGGTAANSKGTTTFKGGDGETGAMPNAGGGAAGKNGAGANGVGNTGGTGDNTTGGTGGVNSGAGNAGLELANLTIGSGGGGGSNSAAIGGDGGLYGGAGGAGQGAAGGNGKQGVLFLGFTPPLISPRSNWELPSIKNYVVGY